MIYLEKNFLLRIILFIVVFSHLDLAGNGKVDSLIFDGWRRHEIFYKDSLSFSFYLPLGMSKKPAQGIPLDALGEVFQSDDIELGFNIKIDASFSEDSATSSHSGIPIVVDGETFEIIVTYEAKEKACCGQYAEIRFPNRDPSFIDRRIVLWLCSEALYDEKLANQIVRSIRFSK